MTMNKLMMFTLTIIHLQSKTWLDCVVCLNFQTCCLHWHYDFHLLLITASWVPLDREFRVKDSMMVKKTKWEIGFPNVKKDSMMLKKPITQRLPSSPRIMPKPYLEANEMSKLIPSHPYILPKTHPIYSSNPVRTPIVPHTTIFIMHPPPP